MSTICRVQHRVTAPKHLRSLNHHLNQTRRLSKDSRPFSPGDLVLLRPKLDRNAPPILTRPLEASRQVNSHRGVIPHTSILGKSVRDVVASLPLRSGKPGTEFRLHEVKLEEYVRLSRRLVTPIYPKDAAVIVEALDLHLDVFDPGATGENEDARLEILEAGTGHGALTLYLARAIHGANPAAPPPPSSPASPEDKASHTAALEAWKPSRRAVLHTLDVSPRITAHASATIAAFKHGIYHPHIDFHTSADVSVWTLSTLRARGGRPFLSHAILDLPGPERHLHAVTQALRTDGAMLVFVPSVTQILACVERVREQGLRLELEGVLELGVNGGSGGREWKVGAVKVREMGVGKVEKGVVETEEVVGEEGVGEDVRGEGADGDGEGEGEEGGDEDAFERRLALNERWSMICRPKVGERIVGGGFLGIWRKQRDMRGGA